MSTLYTNHCRKYSFQHNLQQRQKEEIYKALWSHLQNDRFMQNLADWFAATAKRQDLTRICIILWPRFVTFILRHYSISRRNPKIYSIRKGNLNSLCKIHNATILYTCVHNCNFKPTKWTKYYIKCSRFINMSWTGCSLVSWQLFRTNLVQWHDIAVIVIDNVSSTGWSSGLQLQYIGCHYRIWYVMILVFEFILELHPSSVWEGSNIKAFFEYIIITSL